MSLPALVSEEVVPFWDLLTMHSQGDIPKNALVFTCYLGSWRDKDEESFYTFGYIDQPTVKATGQQIHYVPIDNS